MAILHPNPTGRSGPGRAEDNSATLRIPLIRVSVVLLGLLLLGYMFLGRGFAHLGVPPLYVGEVVLAIGVLATGFALWRNGVDLGPRRIVWLLIGFMALGAIRTVPYLGEYGLDALRDATLWGYAIFALMVVALADRRLMERAFGAYGRVVPVFALWLPVSYSVFAVLSGDIDPSAQGTSVPLIFFKGGDMAVHMVGTIAFLVLGGRAVLTGASVAWRVIIAVPLVWTALVAGAANRGALVTMVLGIALVAALAPRSRNWLPILLATALLVVGLTIQGALRGGGPAVPGATPSLTPSATAPESTRLPSRTGTPEATRSERPGATPGMPTSVSSSRPTATTSPSRSTPGPRIDDTVQIANPDFELGPLDAGVEGWTPFGAGTYRIVGEGGYQDTRFVEIDNTGGAYQATLTSSRFLMTAGKDIEVSLWAKAIRGRPTVEVYVNWYDRFGERISSVFVSGLSTGGSRAWRQTVGVYLAPPDTVEAELLLWEARGSAAIGIDGVRVRAGDFTPEPTPTPTPTPTPRPEGRPATIAQLIENILSVFGSTSDAGLEGTRQFRLAWWGTIIDYTVFGEYFWTGKGFGINLADSDGFQTTLDRSLRAPHNSHITVLARMGVPGVVLWTVLQVAFAIGLLRAVVAFRRARDGALAAIAGWLLAYWLAMMIDTSFDPYLEGPQGGIWFWTVFGLGLVIMRLVPRRRPA